MSKFEMHRSKLTTIVGFFGYLLKQLLIGSCNLMIWIKSDPGLNFPYNKSVRHLNYESVFLKTSEEQNFKK